MDNISRRQSNEDTTTSMYLSFDAESTMSTECYKTLEAMSDISALSSINIDESANRNNTRDYQMNSTIEADSDSQTISPLKTVKKVEISEVKLNTPLKALPKNILLEYKAICSTPSKEQLLKTVDVTRGSDANRCADLGLAFLGIDDEKPAYFPPLNLGTIDENKENALPDTEEASTLSTCSSVEITTSVIEKKMSSVSTIGSITEEDSAVDINIAENINKSKIPIDNLSKNFSLVNNACKNDIELESVNENERQDTDTTPKCIEDNYENLFNGLLNMKEDKKLDLNGLEKKNKQQIAVFNRYTRLSVCEPNLQTGKPSRIINTDNKRRSLLPTSKKTSTTMDAEIEIPLLMNKMLKITNSTKNALDKTEQNEAIVNQSSKKPMTIDKRSSITSTMKTSTHGSKRPFSFTQRMSIIVKTTLNSPARKIARRSVLNGIMPSIQRRSVVPQTLESTDNSKIKKPEAMIRKSMVPKPSTSNTNSQSNSKTLKTLPEMSTQNTNAISQRKSLYPLPEKDGLRTLAGLSHKKPDILYTCNVCKEKFRIKSLLDAHKRSHESDNSPPAFIKKPLTIKQSLSGALLANSNQCKYCDKKFALIKALHIHLLQNCPKIPPSEKRKLQYTDLNHVEKAQLPNFSQNNNLQSNALNIISAASEKPRFTMNKHKDTISKSSSESLNDKKDTKFTSNSNTSTRNKTTSQIIAPKVKKISAHTGVYRTPSKAVPCHLCKLTFKSILDYTNHNLSSHGNKKTSTSIDAGKDIEKN